MNNIFHTQCDKLIFLTLVHHLQFTRVPFHSASFFHFVSRSWREFETEFHRESVSRWLAVTRTGSRLRPMKLNGNRSDVHACLEYVDMFRSWTTIEQWSNIEEERSGFAYIRGYVSTNVLPHMKHWCSPPQTWTSFEWDIWETIIQTTSLRFPWYDVPLK